MSSTLQARNWDVVEAEEHEEQVGLNTGSQPEGDFACRLASAGYLLTFEQRFLSSPRSGCRCLVPRQLSQRQLSLYVDPRNNAQLTV